MSDIIYNSLFHCLNKETKCEIWVDTWISVLANVLFFLLILEVVQFLDGWDHIVLTLNRLKIFYKIFCTEILCIIFILLILCKRMMKNKSELPIEKILFYSEWQYIRNIQSKIILSYCIIHGWHIWYEKKISEFPIRKILSHNVLQNIQTNAF